MQDTSTGFVMQDTSTGFIKQDTLAAIARKDTSTGYIPRGMQDVWRWTKELAALLETF